MPTAIAVTSADLALPPLDAHTPAAHVLAPPGQQPLDAALAEMHLLLERHGHVVVLYPASVPAAVPQRLHTLRSVLDSNRIALLETGLPPLATAVLARQLRRLSGSGLGPGVLGAAARLLARHMHAGALTGSVARLGRVPVGLGAHARSWLPGSRFGVLASPSPRLVGTDERSAPPGPEYATRLTFAAARFPADWVTGTLARRWGVREVEEARLPADSPLWWGTGRLTEFAAAAWDASLPHRLVDAVRREECRWCGLELIGDRCAFCAAAAPPDPQRAAARPPSPERGSSQP